MDSKQLIEHAKRLAEKVNMSNVAGVYAEAGEFLRSFSGPKSVFYEAIREYSPTKFDAGYSANNIGRILRSFAAYVEAGLLNEISPERRAQLDVVSDFLGMSQTLLENKAVHPAPRRSSLEQRSKNFFEIGSRPRVFHLVTRSPASRRIRSSCARQI